MQYTGINVYNWDPVGLWFYLLCTQKTQARLLWRYKVGAQVVHFDDMPFTVSEKWILDCQYGTKYYKSKEHSSSRVYLQGTRKIGCRAHIEITELCLISWIQGQYWGESVQQGSEENERGKSLWTQEGSWKWREGCCDKELLRQPSHCRGTPSVPSNRAMAQRVH